MRVRGRWRSLRLTWQQQINLLEYEQQILEELTSEDGLCITAAGLGWHRVVAAMLAMHDDPQHGETCWASLLFH